MILPVMNAQHIFHCTLSQRASQLAGFAREQWGVEVPGLTQVSTSPALPARVNWNRWIVDCPDCNSAEYVWLDTPVFMCSNCLNATVGGQWRRVSIPAWWQSIERILKARPIPNSRNWSPGEAVTSLRAENTVRGLPEEVS